ncbi:MAG: Ldh family oxidoreductase [Treponema sp.]|jgi:LDH2 family malate/lactate/ureidoglycolate dehydrogenase|nr:Ldh family oxidoreductase [Treponema sp.]
MIYIPRPELEHLCSSIFQKLGIPQEEADDSAKILVAADARGIKSHGVQRMKRYADGIKANLIKGNIQPTVLRKTPVSLTLDAEGGMGLSLSVKAMKQVVAMAKEHGIGVCSIRNSNHFGIAGYYTELAAKEDMIGVALTNTAALGVPTFAKKAMFGTNPIAFAAPGHNGRRFSLDMATTATTRGVIEMYEKTGRKIPPGLAVDIYGLPAEDPVKLLDDMLYQRGGGLLPLGAEQNHSCGYKGYGLAVMVDILTALCSGGVFGEAVHDSAITSARVCHFFMAMRIDIFRDPEDFKTDMDGMLAALASLPPAEGADRVYYAGLREQEAEKSSDENGVPLPETTWEALKSIAEELGLRV